MRGRIGSDARRRDAQATYEKWWLGKYVRQSLARDTEPFKKVIAVKFVGPPSAFYGDVWLTFEDGSEEAVQAIYRGSARYGSAFRPTKKDITVKPEPTP